MPTSKNLATSLHTAPGFSRDGLATLSGAQGDLGFDVHTKEVAPQPQMAVEWFLPAAITWLTSPAGMAVIGTATVTGVFTKVGEQIFTGLMKALKAGKKLDYRFRNSQEYETGAPGKAAPLIKVHFSKHLAPRLSKLRSTHRIRDLTFCWLMITGNIGGRPTTLHFRSWLGKCTRSS